jgi:hypothetical protein
VQGSATAELVVEADGETLVRSTERSLELPAPDASSLLVRVEAGGTVLASGTFDLATLLGSDAAPGVTPDDGPSLTLPEIADDPIVRTAFAILLALVVIVAVSVVFGRTGMFSGSRPRSTRLPPPKRRRRLRFPSPRMSVPRLRLRVPRLRPRLPHPRLSLPSLRVPLPRVRRSRSASGSHGRSDPGVPLLMPPDPVASSQVEGSHTSEAARAPEHEPEPATAPAPVPEPLRPVAPPPPEIKQPTTVLVRDAGSDTQRELEFEGGPVSVGASRGCGVQLGGDDVHFIHAVVTLSADGSCRVFRFGPLRREPGADTDSDDLAPGETFEIEGHWLRFVTGGQTGRAA